VISTVSLRPQIASFPTRLLTSCWADIAGYAHGVIRDFGALAADTATSWLALSVVVSQLADATTTVAALANNLPEQNPISAAVIGRWGIPGLFIEKAVVASVVVFNMARLRGRGARALGLLAVLVGLAAVVWNLHVAA
jgi:hypothetical protein